MVWLLPSCFWWTRLCIIGRTIPLGSTQIEHCPEAWNLSQCCFISLHNTHANMLCRLFDDRKNMDIYLPIPQEYCYLSSPSHLVNCAKCEQIPRKYVANWSVWKVVLKFIKFQSHLNKNLLMVIHSGREWLGIQWVTVTLYFHLREQTTKSLHHGLSKTILVNTRTEVRELKKKNNPLGWWIIYWCFWGNACNNL